VVLRTFSPARAWRPAVVARLARTLGVVILPISFLVASSPTSVTLALGHGSDRSLKGRTRHKPVHSRKARTDQLFGHVTAMIGRELMNISRREQERASLCGNTAEHIEEIRGLCRRRVNRGGALTPTTRRLKDNDDQQSQQFTASRIFQRVRPVAAVLQSGQRSTGTQTTPNPSLKPSPNGGPPGPGNRYGVHFLSPGPGVPPLGPA
jgi:hypothetical protein